MSANIKIAAAAALFLGWSLMAYLQLTPVEPLITAFRDALIALGVFTASMANPKE